jgi:adenylate cyclase
MAYDLFRQEREVIEAAQKLVATGARTVSSEDFAGLAGNYEKLFREVRRLVRMSDRSEAELSRVAKSLDEKNRMLQELSSKLSKYLAPQVYASIFEGRQDVAIRTERKKLTVFFSDIKDFTATTEDLEPEDLAVLLNSYLSEMSRIALDYGATIDKYVGDAMLLFFGDPETCGVKEDAEACVRMAVSMQRRMKELQEQWHRQGYERPFRMRIGINTGYCNVGNFGSDERMDYTIIGGEVNLASRLEGLAEPDGITLSYETYALVKHFLYATEGAPIHVKGIAREVRPYSVVGLMDDLEKEHRFVRRERRGMQFFLDLERIAGPERDAVIAEIEEVIRHIRPQSAVGKAKRPAAKHVRRAAAKASARRSTKAVGA